MKIKSATLFVEGEEPIELPAWDEAGAAIEAVVARRVDTFVASSLEHWPRPEFDLGPEDLARLRLMVEPVPPWVM